MGTNAIGHNCWSDIWNFLLLLFLQPDPGQDSWKTWRNFPTSFTQARLLSGGPRETWQKTAQFLLRLSYFLAIVIYGSATIAPEVAPPISKAAQIFALLTYLINLMELAESLESLFQASEPDREAGVTMAVVKVLCWFTLTFYAFAHNSPWNEQRGRGRLGYAASSALPSSKGMKYELTILFQKDELFWLEWLIATLKS